MRAYPGQLGCNAAIPEAPGFQHSVQDLACCMWQSPNMVSMRLVQSHQEACRYAHSP